MVIFFLICCLCNNRLAFTCIACPDLHSRLLLTPAFQGRKMEQSPSTSRDIICLHWSPQTREHRGKPATMHCLGLPIYLPVSVWGAPAESMVMKLCSDLQANTERTLFNSIIIVLLSWSELLVSSQSGIHEVVSSLEKLRIRVPGAILLMNGDWVQSLALSGTEEQNRQ